MERKKICVRERVKWAQRYGKNWNSHSSTLLHLKHGVRANLLCGLTNLGKDISKDSGVEVQEEEEEGEESPGRLRKNWLSC